MARPKKPQLVVKLKDYEELGVHFSRLQKSTEELIEKYNDRCKKVDELESQLASAKRIIGSLKFERDELKKLDQEEEE